MRMLIPLLLLLASCAKPVPESKIILTAIPALEAIATELTAGTAIEVRYFGDENSTIGEIPQRLKVHPFDSNARAIDAVLSLRSILEADKLYPAIRKHNINALEIDAATSLRAEVPSVGILKGRSDDEPWIWLSLSNMLISAELITADLAALYPADAAAIEANFAALQKESLELKGAYNRKFLKARDFSAATFGEKFDYFSTDINLFVTGHFPLGNWSAADSARYTALTSGKSVATLLHRWKPSGAIGAAAKENGISVTVLSAGTPKLTTFDEGLLSFYRANYEALLTGLSK